MATSLPEHLDHGLFPGGLGPLGHEGFLGDTTAGPGQHLAGGDGLGSEPQ